MTELHRSFGQSAKIPQRAYILIQGYSMDTSLKDVAERLANQYTSSPYLRYLVNPRRKYDLTEENVVPTNDFIWCTPIIQSSYGSWDTYVHEFGLGFCLEARFDNAKAVSRDGHGVYVPFVDSYSARSKRHYAFAFIANFKHDPRIPRLVEGVHGNLSFEPGVFPAHYWKAEVIRPVPGAPRDCTCLRIVRP